MAPVKPVQLCCVTIGYQDFLLPLDKGLKLVEIMQAAIACDDKYEESGYVYTTKESSEVSLKMVKPSQVRMPAGETFTPVPRRGPKLLRGG